MKQLVDSKGSGSAGITLFAFTDRKKFASIWAVV
jgi:hypothetical protein